MVVSKVYHSSACILEKTPCLAKTEKSKREAQVLEEQGGSRLISVRKSSEQYVYMEKERLFESSP